MSKLERLRERISDCRFRVWENWVFIASVVAILALSSVWLLYLFARSDVPSLKSALSTLATVLATFLGFIIVALVLVLQQADGAESETKRLASKYYEFLLGATDEPGKMIPLIERIRRGYVKMIQWEEVELDDWAVETPDWVPRGPRTHREMFAQISKLSSATYDYYGLEPDEEGHSKAPRWIARDLERLGYSDEEVTDIVWVDAMTMPWNAEKFFRALNDTFHPLNFAVDWISEGGRLNSTVWDSTMRDDVYGLLSKLDRAEQYTGNLFRGTISLFLLTIVWDVAVLSGLNESTFGQFPINLATIALFLMAILCFFALLVHIRRIL